MSALDDFLSSPQPTPPATGGSELSKFLSSKAQPAPTTNSATPLAKFIATPTQAPAPAQSTPTPYFQAKLPSGTFVGISDQKDISGTPYFAYRTPGANATTTDTTRVATTFDPTKPQKLTMSQLHNGRMPSSVSAPIKAALGGKYSDELDHTIALELAGSNNPSNLRIEPGRVGADVTPGESADFDTEENSLAQQVIQGKISLWQAQFKLASEKAAAGDGNPIPFTDQQTPKSSIPDNSTLGIAKNTVLGLWPAAKKTATYLYDQGMQTLLPGITTEEANNPTFLATQVAPQIAPSVENIGAQIIKHPVVSLAQIGQGTTLGMLDFLSNAIVNYVPGLVPKDEKQGTIDALHDTFLKTLFPEGQGDIGKGFETAGQATIPIAASGALGEAAGTVGGKVAGAQGEAVGNFAGGTAGFAATGQTQLPSDATIQERAQNALDSLVQQGLFTAGSYAYHLTKGMVTEGAKTAYNALPSMQEAQRGFVKIPGLGDLPEEGAPDYKPQSDTQKPKDQAEDPLLAEARKYSTPEEFATNGWNNTQDKGGIPGETPLAVFGNEDKPIATIRDVEGEDGVILVRQDGSYLLNPKANGVLGGTGLFPNIESAQEAFKPELTDLWNKAHEPSEVKTEKPTRVNTKLEKMAQSSQSFEEFTHRAGVNPESLDATARAKGYADARDFYSKNNPEAVKPQDRAALEQDVEELRSYISYIDDMIKEHPARGLQKYYGGQNPNNVTLDDILARNVSRKTGAKSSQLDSIVTEHGYETPTEAHEGVLEYRKLREQQQALHEQLAQKGRALDAITRAEDAPIAKAMRAREARRAQEVVDEAAAEHGAQHISTPLERSREEARAAQEANRTEQHPDQTSRKVAYNPSITEHNGGVEPPENKGGLQVPEIDFTKAKDVPAALLSRDTMERNIEKIFPRDTAETLKKWLIEPVRANETDRVLYVTDVRKEVEKEIVDKLGIKKGSAASALVQRFGEGRISLDELKQAAPRQWRQIEEASKFFRAQYDTLLDKWNAARAAAGLKPISKRTNYFRHFVELSNFAEQFGFNFRESNLPTAISGITDYFKSQTPWSSAAQRRLGTFTTDDAIKGFDNYLDSASRAIFHTDSVQRGRLLEKYLRNAATENGNLRATLMDKGEDDVPPPVQLPNFASNLNDWTNLVSGKQARLDRAIESVLGRNALTVMRAISRKFGANVIGGNFSAAVTHSIPLSYTLATTDWGGTFRGLTDMARSPFLKDFNTVDGQESSFLTRRFGKTEISPSVLEKGAHILGTPFRLVDQFISRFAVSAKYYEKIQDGLSPKEAMSVADNYASRVIGDRSTGNLPNIMNTKTLGWITQFQIEVNDNLSVLMHDIPYQEHGDIRRVGYQFVKFMVFSYMLNQLYQTMKGSGKGLDPIDMGLTLAGINDAGHDKTFMDRLATAGSDLLKELPFTSLPTQGQIPALQPIIQTGQKIGAGDWKGALAQALTNFASPIGGGVQVQKTLDGIQAWRQGYVTDTNGNVIAKVPGTLPTLVQGVLFGKNAFSDVKSSKQEVQRLDATINQQQAVGKLKNQQAQAIYQQLKGIPAADAAAQWDSINAKDPDMAARVAKLASNAQDDITKTDTLTKSLGVKNGQRAQYLANKLNTMSSNDEKAKAWDHWVKIKIITPEVAQQLMPLLSK
jgi:hypothetical protein